MSAEDSTVSGAPNPNPSSGDSLPTETSAPDCVNSASNKEEVKNSEKDSESLPLGDTNPSEGQNNDEAGHSDIKVMRHLKCPLI